VLHAVLLWVAGTIYWHESASADEQAEEPATHLDLRLATAPARAPEHAVQPLPNAPSIDREKLPSLAPDELTKLDAPTTRDDAIERVMALESATSAAGVGDATAVGDVTLGYAVSDRIVRFARREGRSAQSDRTNVPEQRGVAEGARTGELRPPEFVDAPAPAYPDPARRRGEQGEVRCRLQIDDHGCVIQVTVLVSSGSTLLDEAARTGLLRWRFRPATSGGIACACVVEHVVTFRLVAVH